MDTNNVALMHGMSKPTVTPNFAAIPEQLKARPQWVLHKSEGKKAKVPYQPNGKRASVKNPKTWNSFKDVVDAHDSGEFDGVGFVFTEDDPYCGIDLDGCRDPATGIIEFEAQEIIDTMLSYAEASVSGTGIHLIVRAGVASAQKVQGIEIYDRGRFFTMSGAHIAGTSPTIEGAQQAVAELWHHVVAMKGGGPGGEAAMVAENAIDWDADPESIRKRVEKMIASDTRFAGAWNHERPDLADQSLSTYDMALVSQAAWDHDWHDPTNLYQLIRLHRRNWGDVHKKAQRRDYIRRTVGKALACAKDERDTEDDEEESGEDSDDQDKDTTVVRIRPGGLASATRKAAVALGRATRANARHGIYRFGEVLVQVHPPIAASGQGCALGPGGGAKITRVEPDALEHMLEEICVFKRYVQSRDRWVRIDVPPKVARRLLAKAAGWSEIPVLTGIVEAPVLRRDGTVLDQTGYDPGTGLLFAPGEIGFPPMPEWPTKDEALAGLEKFTALLGGFPFVDKSSLSVALSGIVTPLVRHACRAVPLHVITAPKMASGKTLLATLSSYVLTGRSPRMMSQAENPAEERKRLLAVLLEGAPLIVIDNIERELKSDALCTILTEPYFSDRLLGVSQTVTVPSRTTFFATGNNVAIGGDLTARAIVCALDPGCERPEERTFEINLHEEVPKRRVELVVAALTIVRAYVAAGMPKQNVPHFARFEDWDKFVRYPLIWLGMADPCAGRERIEGRDPVREHLVALLTGWYDVFDSDPVKVGDAIKEATRDRLHSESEMKVEARTVLYEVLVELGGRSGKISPTAVGKFIGNHENRIEGGLRFEKAGKAKGAVLWRVKVIENHSHTASKGEVGKVGEVESQGAGKKCGKIKISTKKKHPEEIGNQALESQNQPHQGHHPHPHAVEVDEVNQTPADEPPGDQSVAAGSAEVAKLMAEL